MSDFDILGFAASGMQAEHMALDVAAHNIALAQTASKGHPVHPLAPVFASIAASFDPAAPQSGVAQDGEDLDIAESGRDDLGDSPDPTSAAADPAALPGAIQYVGTRRRPGAETGIDAVTEMVSVMDAQRAYEFNASTFDAGKRLIQKVIDVGRT